ncbi:MAG: tRNA pseudouridine(38-40) synthase TruA [SAR202 cluster bacterium]|nr:tRNA pseudouridine(38-40) synthase TruA [SAR202 cluster bacterium]
MAGAGQPEKQAPGARRVALIVEYDGTNYMGFQRQAAQPTVQAELENSIWRLTGEDIRVRGASRTDSGAHATGQVVDFLTATPLPLDRIIGGLNFHLPADIKVQSIYQVAEEFHSRRNASSRTYVYRILNRPWPSPLLQRTHHRVRDSLDEECMRRAAAALVGVKDYRPFAVGIPPGRSTVRQVARWEVSRVGEAITIESEANGFLPHQIRRATGLLIEVGKGKLPESIIEEVLAGRAPPELQWPSTPACGLCLVKVKYPNFRSQVRATTHEAD